MDIHKTVFLDQIQNQTSRVPPSRGSSWLTLTARKPWQVWPVVRRRREPPACPTVPWHPGPPTTSTSTGTGTTAWRPTGAAAAIWSPAWRTSAWGPRPAPTWASGLRWRGRSGVSTPGRELSYRESSTGKEGREEGSKSLEIKTVNFCPIFYKIMLISTFIFFPRCNWLTPWVLPTYLLKTMIFNFL